MPTSNNLADQGATGTIRHVRRVFLGKQRKGDCGSCSVDKQFRTLLESRIGC
jgi:hypothetical protein